MIELDVVESLDGLLDLREEWDRLLQRCSYRTPFYKSALDKAESLVARLRR